MTPGPDRTALGRSPWDRAFWLAFAVAACAVVVLAFGPTWTFRLFDSGASYPWIVHLHAAAFVGWMGLFLVQTVLVETGRTGLHRRLGALGGVLTLGLVGLGVLTCIEGARTGYLGPGVPRDTALSRQFMVVPLRDIAWFTGSVGLALLLRRRPEAHRRLMALAFVGGILPVALARVPEPWGLSGFVFLLGPPLYDLVTRRRLHLVYGLGIPLFVGSTIVVQPIAESAAWGRFADWLVG